MEEFSFLLRAQELAASWNKPMAIVILGDFAGDIREVSTVIADIHFVLKPLTLDVAERWIGLLQ